MKLEDLDSKEKVIQNFFEWVFSDNKILDKNTFLHKEIDYALAPYYYDANIYYPNQIYKLFETKAMKRIDRINHLALAIDIFPNAYHTRLEHSKGVYNKKLEELLYCYQNSNWKSYIEKNDLKIYLLADLIKMLGHDIGHLPLSHALEEQIYHTHDAHEIIGERIMLEDTEIKDILSSISPDLHSALTDLYNKKILNFKEHDESNYDVDRLDYLSRDNLYIGKPIHIELQQYESIYNDNCILDVYPFSSLKKIESFLEERENSYINIYLSKPIHLRESAIGNFIKCFLSSESIYGKNLRNFIINLQSKNITNIDISEYLQWDDIKLYNEIIDIAKNHENKNIRDLATMTIPNLKSFFNMIYAQLKLNKSEKYSTSDKIFLQKIKSILTNNDELSHNLRNDNFIDNNILILDNNISLPQNYTYLVNSNLIENCHIDIFAYKKKDPIYIKDSKNNIYELSKHPNRSCDWDNRIKQINYKYCYIPYLKYNGITDEEIINLKKIFSTPNKYFAQNNKSTLNMQPLQVNHNIHELFIERE